LILVPTTGIFPTGASLALDTPYKDGSVTPAEGGWHGLWASVRYLAVFAIAAAVAGSLIAFATDDGGYGRYRPWITEKLAVLSARPPVPNAIFVGASVTLRTVVPSVVDAAAAAAGCPNIRSINLGMPKARVFETAFMIDKVLETPDLEPGTFVIFDAISAEEVTFREIATSERTPVTARFRYAPDLIGSDRWSWDHLTKAAAYLRAAIGESLAVHVLSDIAMQPWHQNDQFDNTRVVNRGYVSLESEDKQERRQRYIGSNEGKHLQSLRKWDLQKSLADMSGVPMNPFADRIRSAGLVPVAFAAPYRNGRLAAVVQRAKQSDPKLGALMITPENAPQIFAGTELWFDQGHMSVDGARYVSAIIGRELCLMTKKS
jgi:hypothetical protein